MKRQVVVSALAVPVLCLVFAAASTAAPAKRVTKAARPPAAAVAAKSSPAPAAPAKRAPVAAPVKQVVDINSATLEQLAALPGIGDAYAQKIVDGRPYRIKSELRTKKILPVAAYQKVVKLIVARQATAAK